ncbi:MAG: cation:proton antiporter [Desulfuromonadales bacterium C00003068]|jgi:multicomponent Na+:H+ antiporter subunit F|nr:MAG: cation:proton antiporter [Desulfuromonadales bacterium C00003068]
MADLLIYIATALTGVAFLLALVRFIIGPVAVDRVIAFDVLTIISVTGIVLIAVLEDKAIYLDVALVYALLSFLGVIVVARYLEGGSR